MSMTHSYQCIGCAHNKDNILNELIGSILEWAEEKEILSKGTPKAQMDKTHEEINELRDGIILGNRDEIIDGIGDSLVTLIIQAELQGLTITDCLIYAFNEIKDRDGEMINGTFVKEE